MNVSKLGVCLIFLSIMLSLPNIMMGQVFSNEIIPIEIESTLKTELITIDVNGDGDLDIIHRGQDLVLYLNMGGFVFEEQGVIEAGIGIDLFNHDVVDFNNDGLEDIIFAQNFYSSSVYLLLSLGDGSFELDVVELNNLGLSIIDVSAADYDNDGDIDLLFNNSNMSIILYEQTSPNTFELVEEFSVFNINGICLNFVDFVDLNNDGSLDLVGDYNDGYLIWYENEGNNSFSSFKTILNDTDNYPFFYHEFIDFDQDGDLDVVLGVDNTELIAWLVNENGNFDLIPFTGDLIFNFASLDVGDVDNDGDTDFIFGGNTENGNNATQVLRLYTNDANGGFPNSVISSDLERICRSRLIDLNNDSFLDLLVTYTEGTQLRNAVIPNVLGSPSLSGCIYFDENENGLRDLDERELDGIQLNLDPSDLKLLTNENGCYAFFVDEGEFTITPDFPAVWKVTSDSSSFTVTIDGNSVSDLDFGFAAAQQLLAGQMHAVSGITRCNRETKFDFIFQNTGTTIITEGVVFAFLDDLVSIGTEIDPIDTIGVTGELGWKFENLYPGQTVKKSILLNIPGLGGDVEPGTLIKIFSATEAKDTQGFVNFFKNNFESEILCAYDPNDKLVNPDREGDENYTQFKDTMIYTVRFQNTGNDTAFTVVIRDTLDQNLDVSTFNILGSSHREVLTTEILDNQFVSFSFEDILLPDSTIDFIGSQGYVSYSIEPKDGISENTIIENTASIFFDFNPPIVTNTTRNTMVECLPITATDVSVILEAGETYTLPDGTVVDQAGVYTTQTLDEDDCPIETTLTVIEVLTSSQDLVWNQYVKLSPNPAEAYFYLDIETNTAIDHEVVIFNILGEKMQRQKVNEKSNRINILDLAAGTYMLQLTHVDKGVIAVKKLIVL